MGYSGISSPLLNRSEDEWVFANHLESIIIEEPMSHGSNSPGYREIMDSQKQHAWRVRYTVMGDSLVRSVLGLGQIEDS